MGKAHSDAEPDLETDLTGIEADLDAALEALTRTGWQSLDPAATSSVDVQHLVSVAAELRRALAAWPSPQASLRHRALISHAARSLPTTRLRAVPIL